MVKATDIVKLIETLSYHDYNQSKNVIEEIIAYESRQNRPQSAQLIERALHTYWPTISSPASIPRGLESVLWTDQPNRSLAELYINNDMLEQIQQFILERGQIARLREAGLPARNRVLLSGPPGNGKTSSALALAKELNINFLALKSSTVVDAYIGRTGRKLAQVFDYVENNDCLLFIDELDTLGSARIGGAGSGQSEYNRIVNAILTSLDRLPDTSIIIGATNLERHLDPALKRRFNLHLILKTPSDYKIKRYVKDYQRKHRVVFPEANDAVIEILHGMPWSKVEEFCLGKHREILLN